MSVVFDFVLPIIYYVLLLFALPTSLWHTLHLLSSHYDYRPSFVVVAGALYNYVLLCRFIKATLAGKGDVLMYCIPF